MISSEINDEALSATELERAIIFFAACGGMERDEDAISRALVEFRVNTPSVRQLSNLLHDVVHGRATERTDGALQQYRHRIGPSPPPPRWYTGGSEEPRPSSSAPLDESCFDAAMPSDEFSSCGGISASTTTAASSTTTPGLQSRYVTQEEWLFLVSELKRSFITAQHEGDVFAEERESFNAIAEGGAHAAAAFSLVEKTNAGSLHKTSSAAHLQHPQNPPAIDCVALQALCSEFGLDVAPFLAALDDNDDGVVDFTEFLALVSSTEDHESAYLPSFVACGGREVCIDDSGVVKRAATATHADDTVLLLSTRDLKASLPYFPAHLLDMVPVHHTSSFASHGSSRSLKRKGTVSFIQKRLLSTLLPSSQLLAEARQRDPHTNAADAISSETLPLPFDCNPGFVTLPRFALLMRRWGRRPRDINYLLQDRFTAMRKRAAATSTSADDTSFSATGLTMLYDTVLKDNSVGGQPSNHLELSSMISAADYEITCAAAEPPEASYARTSLTLSVSPSHSALAGASSNGAAALQQQPQGWLGAGNVRQGGRRAPDPTRLAAGTAIVGSRRIQATLERLVQKHDNLVHHIRSDPANDVFDKIDPPKRAPSFSPKRERSEQKPLHAPKHEQSTIRAASRLSLSAPTSRSNVDFTVTEQPSSPIFPSRRVCEQPTPPSHERTHFQRPALQTIDASPLPTAPTEPCHSPSGTAPRTYPREFRATGAGRSLAGSNDGGRSASHDTNVFDPTAALFRDASRSASTHRAGDVKVDGSSNSKPDASATSPRSTVTPSDDRLWWKHLRQALSNNEKISVVEDAQNAHMTRMQQWAGRCSSSAGLTQSGISSSMSYHAAPRSAMPSPPTVGSACESRTNALPYPSAAKPFHVPTRPNTAGRSRPPISTAPPPLPVELTRSPSPDSRLRPTEVKAVSAKLTRKVPAASSSSFTTSRSVQDSSRRGVTTGRKTDCKGRRTKSSRLSGVVAHPRGAPSDAGDDKLESSDTPIVPEQHDLLVAVDSSSDKMLLHEGSVSAESSHGAISAQRILFIRTLSACRKIQFWYRQHHAAQTAAHETKIAAVAQIQRIGRGYLERFDVYAFAVNIQKKKRQVSPPASKQREHSVRGAMTLQRILRGMGAREVLKQQKWEREQQIENDMIDAIFDTFADSTAPTRTTTFSDQKKNNKVCSDVTNLDALIPKDVLHHVVFVRSENSAMPVTEPITSNKICDSQEVPTLLVPRMDSVTRPKDSENPLLERRDLSHCVGDAAEASDPRNKQRTPSEVTWTTDAMPEEHPPLIDLHSRGAPEQYEASSLLPRFSLVSVSAAGSSTTATADASPHASGATQPQHLVLGVPLVANPFDVIDAHSVDLPHTSHLSNVHTSVVHPSEYFAACGSLISSKLRVVGGNASSTTGSWFLTAALSPPPEQHSSLNAADSPGMNLAESQGSQVDHMLHPKLETCASNSSLDEDDAARSPSVTQHPQRRASNSAMLQAAALLCSSEHAVAQVALLRPLQAGTFVPRHFEMARAGSLLLSVLNGYHDRKMLAKQFFVAVYNQPVRRLQKIGRGCNSRRLLGLQTWALCEARDCISRWGRMHSAAIRIQCFVRCVIARSKRLVLQRRVAARTEMRVVADKKN